MSDDSSVEPGRGTTEDNEAGTEYLGHTEVPEESPASESDISLDKIAERRRAEGSQDR